MLKKVPLTNKFGFTGYSMDSGVKLAEFKSCCMILDCFHICKMGIIIEPQQSVMKIKWVFCKLILVWWERGTLTLLNTEKFKLKHRCLGKLEEQCKWKPLKMSISGECIGD